MVDHVENDASLNIPPVTTRKPTARSRKALSLGTSSLLALSSIEATSNNHASAPRSKQSPTSDATAFADNMQSQESAPQQALLPSYKTIPIGSDILSDLRGKLNDLHRDLIDIDGDYWILTGMFEKISEKVFENHGWKSPRENHRPIFLLETEIENLKDMTLAYGNLSDLDPEKIDHTNTLKKLATFNLMIPNSKYWLDT